MDRETALRTLKRAEIELKKLGIRHAAIFGSVARGDAGPASDLDVLIDIDPDLRIGVYDYVGITQQVAALFPGKVDVTEQAHLKTHIRANVLADAIYAF